MYYKNIVYEATYFFSSLTSSKNWWRWNTSRATKQAWAFSTCLTTMLLFFGPCAPKVRTYVDVKMVYRDNEWFIMRHYYGKTLSLPELSWMSQSFWLAHNLKKNWNVLEFNTLGYYRFSAAYFWCRCGSICPSDGARSWVNVCVTPLIDDTAWSSMFICLNMQ